MTSPYYRNWSNARDRALEVIHRRCQKEISDLARRSFLNIINSIRSHMARINDDNRFTAMGKAHLFSTQRYIDTELHLCGIQMLPSIVVMRRRTVRLMYASELEVLARLKSAMIHGTPPDTLPLGRLSARIDAALSRLGDRLKEEVERGYVNGKSADEIADAVKAKFPKPVRYKKPPRELKPFREAEPKTEFKISKDASLAFISNDEWDDIIDTYKDTYVPTHRGPEYVFDRDIGEPELEEWYGWEVEQEVAQDFVERVRDGTSQAAKDAGIDDLMWVAILDDRTRPEHHAKHGLTSRQIEAKLENEWADFEDQTIVPPGGFNCRCRAAPYDSTLPEAPEFQYEDFDTWVTSD